MRFMHPSLLAWGAVLAVPIILYLFRRKPRKVRVSTLLFFKSLAREHQESAWLRRLKRLFSFLLSAAVIAFATFGLARLVVSPPAGSLKSVVVLVDRSASMAARDEKGGTRLEEAKALVRERLAGLPAGVPVSVMTYDTRPEIILPRSLDRRQVERAIASIETRPIEGDAEGALELARRVAALETPSSIWHATDNVSHRQDAKDAGNGEKDRGSAVSVSRAANDATPASVVLGVLGVLAVDGVAVEDLNVALASPVNAGITAFQLRPTPLARGRFEAFIELRGVSAEPLNAKLEIRLGDALVALREVTLEPGGLSGTGGAGRKLPGGRERLLVPVAATSGRTLSLKISADGDCLAADDEVHARVPEVRPVRALWITPEPDPFTRLALASLCDGSGTDGGDGGGGAGGMGGVEVLQGGPDAWPPPDRSDGQVDVAVFDGWLPGVWPKDVSVIVIDPPGSAGPVRAARIEGGGVPTEALRPTDERHPVLYGVATPRVEVTQTAVLETDGPLEPLWVGPSGPVLAAGDVRGQRIVVMAFAPGESARLPLMASFPLLIGNAIYWSAAGGGDGSPDARGAGTNYRTGELVACSGGTITWSVPDALETRESTVAPARRPTGSPAAAGELRGRLVELDRVGLWSTDAGEEGSAALLSARETRLRKKMVPDTISPKIVPDTIFRGDLTPLLVWGILVTLLAESYLFHRRAVY